MKGVNVVFAHDTELALGSAAALVNTVRNDTDRPVELLPDLAALDAFLDSWRWSGRRDHDEAELLAVRALRPRLDRLWLAGEAAEEARTEEVGTDAVDEVVDLVNAMLRDARALPQLLRHDGFDYHLHATPTDAALADRMAVEAAMAMIDVVRVGELSRLRVCAAGNCERVLVDLSKNRSRRFCEAGCGNRANVAAYRARRQQA